MNLEHEHQNTQDESFFTGFVGFLFHVTYRIEKSEVQVYIHHL
jgi:hypothetical protein